MRPSAYRRSWERVLLLDGRAAAEGAGPPVHLALRWRRRHCFDGRPHVGGGRLAEGLLVEREQLAVPPEILCLLFGRRRRIGGQMVDESAEGVAERRVVARVEQEYLP